ncbi:MAG: M28 family metallopeptidase [Terriglobia bacterium]
MCVLALAGGSLSQTTGPPAPEIRGFSPSSAKRQAELEKAFRAVPTAERARLDLWALTSAPHVAGTPEDYETAKFVLEQFRAAGLDAEIIDYRVLLPMPREVKVDLVEPFKREGPTPEGAQDLKKRAKTPDFVPAFNAYSPSGDVTARVVYANYGLPEDYERLKELGVDVAGSIVLVRYGKCFRGVKAYVAQQSRAAGVLIYSDPADDGYRQGDAYPRGPWRPPDGVQRGSILYMTDYAGDPLTPGIPATAEAKRLALKDAPTLPRIPTTPISYEDASPILENLGGPVAPQAWQGALPLTYHVGPGAAKVRLKLDMDFRLRSIWNVVARIPGSSQPESWVVLGNHRDAWTYGAVDPASGTAPLLAVARGLGQLLKGGWRPQRTLVLASWDAEEFGLIGSTEWMEDNAAILDQHAVAYLNMDSGVSGTHFGASAVPSLGRLIREATRDVTDPDSGRSLFSVWSEEAPRVRREGGIPYLVLNNPPVTPGIEARVGDLGSGSDYTPFLQHAGVPSLDIGFAGPYGVYHSVYDNFDWMQEFGDPSFRYSVAAAQVYGTLALRLADAQALPFDFEDYGKALLTYLSDLEAEAQKGDPAGRLQFDEAKKSAERFTAAARKLNRKLTTANADGEWDPRYLSSLNQSLMKVERSFLLPGGLPGRAWFRHAFYAPGVYTGYSAVIFPGVREALARRDWPGAREQLRQVQAAIDRGTATLARASESSDQAGASRR